MTSIEGQADVLYTGTLGQVVASHIHQPGLVTPYRLLAMCHGGRRRGRLCPVHSVFAGILSSLHASHALTEG